MLPLENCFNEDLIFPQNNTLVIDCNLNLQGKKSGFLFGNVTWNYICFLKLLLYIFLFALRLCIGVWKILNCGHNFYSQNIKILLWIVKVLINRPFLKGMWDFVFLPVSAVLLNLTTTFVSSAAVRGQSSRGSVDIAWSWWKTQKSLSPFIFVGNRTEC